MKIRSLFFAVIIVLFFLPPQDAIATASLNEEQALNVLISQIKKDKLYDSWTTLSCLSFMTDEKTARYFIFAIHEKHGGKCPGDPNTYPTVDRFRVNRQNRKIQWNDVVQDKWLPYAAVLKSRLNK